MTSAGALAARVSGAAVAAPRPLLPPETEVRLTGRQREILDALETLAVEQGFAGLTMAELAARVNCSLRTLYGIAPSKGDLLLMVVDRRLHRIGREAMSAIEPAMGPLAALRAYLAAATSALGPATESLARELAAVPGARRLIDAHSDYVIAVTESLLVRAREDGAIPAVDTAALALVLGGLGGYFSRPEVIPRLADTPKEAADAITDIILRGLGRD